MSLPAHERSSLSRRWWLPRQLVPRLEVGKSRLSQSFPPTAAYRRLRHRPPCLSGQALDGPRRRSSVRDVSLRSRCRLRALTMLRPMPLSFRQWYLQRLSSSRRRFHRLLPRLQLFPAVLPAAEDLIFVCTEGTVRSAAGAVTVLVPMPRHLPPFHPYSHPCPNAVRLWALTTLRTTSLLCRQWYLQRLRLVLCWIRSIRARVLSHH
jgi:hypothetical protein